MELVTVWMDLMSKTVVSNSEMHIEMLLIHIYANQKHFEYKRVQD